MVCASSGSVAASVRQRDGVSTATFNLHDLVHAPLMAAALEDAAEPQRDDLLGEPEADDASAKRQHVCVVVLARQPRGVQIVAQRRAHPRDLVGGDLLALAAAADDDAAIGAARDDQ